MKNFWSAIKAVFSAFTGIRNSSDAHLPHVRPHHYIIAGVAAVILLIITLLTLVNIIV